MRARSAPAVVAVTVVLAFTGACGDGDADPPDSPRGAEDPTLDRGEGGEGDPGSESDVEPRTGEGGVPTTDY